MGGNGAGDAAQQHGLHARESASAEHDWLGLDEIASEIAQATMQRGVELACGAGFDASGELKSGKAWRAICDAAEEIRAEPIVLGARGLSRVQSLLLGSVSAAVAAHAGRALLIVPASEPGAGGAREVSPLAGPEPTP